MSELSDVYIEIYDACEQVGVRLEHIFEGRPKPYNKAIVECLLEMVVSQDDIRRKYKEDYLAFLKRVCIHMLSDGMDRKYVDFCVGLGKILADGEHLEVTEDGKIGFQQLEITADQLPQLYADPDFTGETIITRDGRIYPAKISHEILSRILISQGINIKGAIRSEARDDKLLFSSMLIYGYIDSRLKGDKSVMLTDEQALSMYDIFESLKMSGHCAKGRTFSRVIQESENMGYLMCDVDRFGDKVDMEYLNNYVTRRNVDSLIKAVFTRHPADCFHQDHAIVGIEDILIADNDMRRPSVRAPYAEQYPSNEYSNPNLSEEEVDALIAEIREIIAIHCKTNNNIM